MKVIKRDDQIVEFDQNKIKNAITKANESLKRSGGKITVKEIEDVTSEIGKVILESTKKDSKKDKSKYIAKIITKTGEEAVHIEAIQDLVQNILIKHNFYELATAYITYRADRTRVRENKSDFMSEIIGKATAKDVENQNANVDEMSFGGRKGEADSVVMRRLALDSVSKKARDNHVNNRIYIHDLDSYYIGNHNCLSIPFDDMLNNGFNTRQTDLRPARSINTAFQLYAVGFQLQSLQQFGGCAATHLDTTSVPFFRISFEKNYNFIQDVLPFVKVNKDLDETKPIYNKQYTGNWYNFIKKYISKKALDKTIKELNQSAEAMYHNLNTLQSRSGLISF